MEENVTTPQQVKRDDGTMMIMRMKKSLQLVCITIE